MNNTRIPDVIKTMLLILGFENIIKLPKIKDVMKKYYKLALKTHPDKPGGSKEEFQKLEEALRVAGDYITKNTVEKDDPEESLAKDLFIDMFSQFNTKKENKKCTTILINNHHDFAWNNALTIFCGESTEKAEGEKHWKDNGFKINGEHTTVTIRKWTNPKNDGQSKMNIQSKNLHCVQMWVLSVLPSIFDRVLDIVKTVVVDTNQTQTDRVTRTRATNKNGTKCNECDTIVQSFTDLSKHKKMFHVKINNTSAPTVLARKNLQKMKTNCREVQEIINCKTCDIEFSKKSELENHITNNHSNKSLEGIQTVLSGSDTESLANEFIDSIMDDVIKRFNKIECTHCGKLYQRPYMLKKHIESNHQTEITRPSLVHIVDIAEDKNKDGKEDETVEDDEGETEESVTTITCRKSGETDENRVVPDKHTSFNPSHTDQQKLANEINKHMEAFSTEKNLRLKAQKDLEEFETQHNELKAEKDKLNNEFLQKINELEKKHKDEMKKHMKTIKLQQTKITLFENTVKNYVSELDKQVQLKEKFAEEKKTLTNIIKTHIELKDLKIDLQDVLCGEKAKLRIPEPITVSEDEWEDIETVSDNQENDGFVKVMNKNKKKQLRRRIALKENKHVNCTKCDETFTSKSKLNVHLRQHMPESNKENCEKSGDTFQTEQHMNDHKTTHRSKSDYECRKCEQTFITEQELTGHTATEHKEINPIKCQLCKFQAVEQVNFLLHMESHNNENNKNELSYRKKTCSWYLKNKCRYGTKCWNSHSDPPQCIFKNKCRAWPSCKFGHYEVCQNFKQCENQNCFLEHPSQPFLGPVWPQKTPNIHSTQEFPRLQRGPGRH